MKSSAPYAKPQRVSLKVQSDALPDTGTPSRSPIVPNVAKIDVPRLLVRVVGAASGEGGHAPLIPKMRLRVEPLQLGMSQKTTPPGSNALSRRRLSQTGPLKCHSITLSAKQMPGSAGPRLR
jgi:hypothetical protein